MINKKLSNIIFFEFFICIDKSEKRDKKKMNEEKGIH